MASCKTGQGTGCLDPKLLIDEGGKETTEDKKMTYSSDIRPKKLSIHGGEVIECDTHRVQRANMTNEEQHF